MTTNSLSAPLVRLLGFLLWPAVALLGAAALGGIALNRGESINSLWLIVAALCVYALGYRFYSAFVAAKVLMPDATRATPAERLADGRDFIPTHRWIVFGHHFAAIAGPGIPHLDMAHALHDWSVTPSGADWCIEGALRPASPGRSPA